MIDGPLGAGRRANPKRDNLWLGLIVSVLLIAFALRVYRLGDQRVWWDEGWSVWVSRFILLDILRESGHDVHPPLYFSLLHLWQQVGGQSETALRLLSAFMGTLTVAMTYVLGRDIGRDIGRTSAWVGTGRAGIRPAPTRVTAARATGLLAALFLTFSRFAVAWSQEIRMYALASLLAVIALWTARRVWDRGRGVDGLLYLAAMTAGLYTLYLFALIFVAVNLAWLWELWNAAGRRRSLVRWVVLQVAVLLLFLPWVVYAAGGFLSTGSATPISLPDFLHIYWTVLTVGIPLNVAQYNHLTIPALVIFLMAIGSLIVVALRILSTGRQLPNSRSEAPWRMARDLTLLLVVVVLPAAVIYIVSLPRQNFYNPPFSPRYLVIFTSFYSILLAWGLVTLGQVAAAGWKTHRASGIRWGVTVVLSAVMLLVAWSGLRLYHPGRVLVDDYQSLVDTIETYRQSNDAVILYSDTDWPIFAYHYNEAWQGVPHQWSLTPETAADYLAPIWESHNAIWLVTTPTSAGGDPQRLLPQWLQEQATAERSFDYDDMALTLYTRTAERGQAADALVETSPDQYLDRAIGPDMRLTGYAQATQDFKSGDVIHLFLYWQGGQEAEVEVGLIDSVGRRWPLAAEQLSADETMVRGQIDLVIPPDLEDGDYRFYVAGEVGETEPFGRLSIRQKQAEFVSEDDISINNRTDTPFDEGIRLLGYDGAGTVMAGNALPLTLYWQSEGSIDHNYKVFTHLLGETYNATTGNFIWGQVDSEPAGNSRPTTTWRAQEVIVDGYAIPIQADAPPGVYRLEIGLYDPVSGERVAVLDEDGVETADHVILTAVEVIP